MDKNKETKTSLSDIPFEENVNDFGTERYVNGLIRFIENSSAPVTIALQGEWGSGKTSLMNRLKHSLCDDSKTAKFIGVEINTWEYSMLSSPEATVYKIIAKLVKDLSQDDPNAHSKFAKFARNFANTAFRAAREGAKVVGGSVVSTLIEGMNVPTELCGASKETEAVTLSDLKAALEQSVADQIEKSDKTKQGVIVFVDDLDRLNPPVAVEILELLKNIFCINNCIFILAIDYEVVVKGLEPKFGKLTDQNEREFRSFFDKIIQVPFSLPVSSYRPMDFVFESLVNIGYISSGEKGDKRICKPFQTIVEKSVGKNPRSIKRLINTLSLLSCIAHCGEKDENSEFLESREGRIVNFAIVAMQVCYPKIYRMLATMPDFEKWDNTIITRFNIPFKPENDNDAPDWTEILEAACSPDKYLTQHFDDIQSILNLIITTLMNSTTNNEIDGKIRAIIDKSSITGISEQKGSAGEVDCRRLIGNLHKNVIARIREKRSDIGKIAPKRNTGNGGFWMQFPDGTRTEAIIWPQIVDNKIIRCQLHLKTQVFRPERLMGKFWDEMMQDPQVAKLISIMDNCVAPLLKNVSYFEGQEWPEEAAPDKYFMSFAAEEKCRCDKGWQNKVISNDISYFISLDNEEQFSDRAVVDTIADVVIALYDYQLAAKSLN